MPSTAAPIPAGVDDLGLADMGDLTPQELHMLGLAALGAAAALGVSVALHRLLARVRQL